MFLISAQVSIRNSRSSGRVPYLLFLIAKPNRLMRTTVQLVFPTVQTVPRKITHHIYHYVRLLFFKNTRFTNIMRRDYQFSQLIVCTNEILLTTVSRRYKVLRMSRLLLYSVIHNFVATSKTQVGSTINWTIKYLMSESNKYNFKHHLTKAELLLLIETYTLRL